MNVIMIFTSYSVTYGVKWNLDDRTRFYSSIWI